MNQLLKDKHRLEELMSLKDKELQKLSQEV